VTEMEERVARAIHGEFVRLQPRPDDWPTWGALIAEGHQGAHRVSDTRALARAVLIELRKPTEAMLIAARDWSYAKYGKPIGNDAAIGCWQAMIDVEADVARTAVQSLEAALEPPT
jgi:hypothetical protein